MISSTVEHCLVLRGQNGLYDVELPPSEGGTLLACRAGSVLRKTGLKLCAGDRVTVEDNGDGTGFIRAADERRNALVRPPLANIGLLFLVIAASDPAPNLFTADKMTVIAEKEDIPVAIAVTKCELGGGETIADVYRKTPYPVFLLSDGGKKGGAELLDFMRGKITAFCGASGVGKSTLLNTLFPSLHANVGGLSAKIRRGKNTTRVTSLHNIGNGTYVADTPGFTSLDVTRCAEISKEELPGMFPDIYPLTGNCRYTHCTHLCEEGCRVVEAVRNGEIAPSRHESYCVLYRERKAHPVYPSSKNVKTNTQIQPNKRN